MTAIDSFIVKVQVPLSTNRPDPQALVYNEDRSALFEVPASDALLKRMAGSAKQFFFAEKKGEELHLGKKAPWQPW